MPIMKDFADGCASQIGNGDVKVYLPVKSSASKSKTSTATRELNMLSWSFGSIYAGEIPADLFRREKPKLRAILSSPEESAEFHLSSAACAGVLKRDENRGRPLPQELKAALVRLASQESDVQ